MTDLPSWERRQKGLLYIRSTGTGFESLTVDEVLSLEELEPLRRLQPLLGQPVKSLSGGERKMLALNSLMGTPPVVALLDEPLLGLDSSARSEALRMIRDLGDTAVLLCTPQAPSTEQWENPQP